MASMCGRMFQRSSISTIRSAISKTKPSSINKPSANTSAFSRSSVPSNSAPSSVGRFTISSRLPRELGGAASLLPLHSAVAQARMTSCLSLNSRNCRALSQDEIDGT